MKEHKVYPSILKIKKPYCKDIHLKTSSAARLSLLIIAGRDYRPTKIDPLIFAL
jgi:hypothetical protein